MVFDKAYYDYVEDKNYPDSLSYVLEGKNIIILRSSAAINKCEKRSKKNIKIIQ